MAKKSSLAVQKSSAPISVLAVVCLGTVLDPQTVVGQSKAPPPANNSGTTGTTSNSSVPTSSRAPASNSNYPTVNRPIFLSGKVQIADGTPIPPGVSIQRVCGANTRSVAYTDNKGRFQFEWGHTQGMLPDASNSDNSRGFGSGMPSTSNVPMGQSSSANAMLSGTLAENELSGCELRAVAAGFRSDSVNLSGRRPLDSPDVGVIVLHRLGNVEGTSISATSLAAPKDAKKAYDKGIEFMHKGKTDDAAKSFDKAVVEYPKYADAWYQLGRMRAVSENAAGAREAFVKALEADPKLVGPSVELGMILFRDKKWQESVDYLDRAVRLDPVDFPQAWYASAISNYNLKNYTAAEKAAREAMKLDTKGLNPRCGYLLGLILAEKGDFTGAATQLREYLKNSTDTSDIENVRKQLSQVEKLASSTPADQTKPQQ